MAIAFTKDDWARIRETYSAWWNDTLKRPLIKAILHYDYVYQGNIPILSQETCHRLDVSPEDVIERIHLELENQEYLGDAFPMVNFSSFGPGVAAAFLGAELNNHTGGVWFHSNDKREIADMHYEYDPKNKWLNRIKDLYHAANKKWKGNVLMGMPDLGGVMDVVATLRGSEQLLTDLYDEPEEVKRLSGEIQDLWLRFYRELEEVSMETNPGYSDWSGIFCAKPSYIVQCDFCYMIGPEVFREFIAGDLKRLCGALSHSIYHLDGKGQLNHLPQILEMPEVDGIQWVPGDGAPRPMEWLSVYRQIRSGGKKIYVVGDETDFRAIASEVGSKGLYLPLGERPAAERETIQRFLAECGF